MRNLTTGVWVRATIRLRSVRQLRSERGLTTTEVAVLTFILVAVAVAIGGLIYGYAQDTVAGNPAPSDLTPNIPNS